MSEFLNGMGIGSGTIFKILIPSTLGGLFLATIVMAQFHTKLDHGKDCLKNNAMVQPITSKAAKFSVICFCLGSLMIALLSSIKSICPCWVRNGTTVYLPTSSILPLVMLSSAACIMLILRISPQPITQGKAFMSGIQGMCSLLGIAWLSSTFVESNQAILLKWISSHLSARWQFAIILLIMSAIMGSSAATIKAMLPLGMALGIAPKVLLASVIAVNGVFIIPIYPTILSAINLDSTGTTRIGKYFFNHSFMLPGLITIFRAIGIAFLLIYIFLPT